MKRTVNFRKKLGLRSIKTAIAVVIGLYLSHILKLYTPLYTSIASITSMQNNMYESFKDVTKRAFTAIFGVTLGYFLSRISSDPYVEILVGGFGILLILYILNALDLTRMSSLSCIVFMASFFSKIDKFDYAINRVIGTLIGIGIGIIVNITIARPRINYNFYDRAFEIFKTYREIFFEIVSNSNFESENNISNHRKALEDEFYKLSHEVETPIHERIDISNSKRFLNIVREIEIRLSLLNSLSTRYLNENNRAIIEKNFMFCFIYDDIDKSDINYVYNYHVAHILKFFEEMEEILEKIKP